MYECQSVNEFQGEFEWEKENKCEYDRQWSVRKCELGISLNVSSSDSVSIS